MSHRPSACQALERRVLLAFFNVPGTDGDDLISVAVNGPNLVANVNGAITSASDADVTGILINGFAGNDTLIVESNSDNATTINGGLGNDAVFLAPTSQRVADITAFVMVNGDDGFDSLSLSDVNGSAGVSYQITGAVIGRSNGPAMLPRVESFSLMAGPGNDFIEMSRAGPNLVNAGPGTDTIDIRETGNSVVTLTPSVGDDIVGVNTDDVTVSRLDLVAQRLGSLAIHTGGIVRLFADGAQNVMTTASLSLSGTAVLDAAENHIVIDYSGPSPLASIQAALTSGYAGGAWNGTGINSSVAAAQGNAALGYAEATDLFTTFPAPFLGQSVDDTSVLVRYTLYGDHDLNGTVNLDDFNRLASNFGQTNRRWSQGNSDYNGTVDLSDFNRLAANFGATASMAPVAHATNGRSSLRDLIDSLR